MERRHRHLREGARRDATPTPATRPTTRSASTAASCAPRCVGEGGNLGLTQLRPDRVRPAARRGGAINTDFIDNSAGVDTSDHEVNIKILLDRVVARRRPDRASSATRLLAEMTDEVAALVLRDNYEQNLALANAAGQRAVAAPRARGLDADASSATGVLNRELEGLPDRARGAPAARARARA